MQQRTYWGQLNPARQDNWVFGDKHTGRHMLKYSWFPIERHLLVKGTASPDDPTLKDYWQQRTTAKARDLAPNRYKLAMKQMGLCPMCRNSLFNEEEVQVHHKVPKAQGARIPMATPKHGIAISNTMLRGMVDRGFWRREASDLLERLDGKLSRAVLRGLGSSNALWLPACWDNALMESFNATLKGECCDRQSWSSHAQARRAIFEFIEIWYNRQRRHSSLGYISPIAFEQIRA